jgi:tRNA A-37 threonylcarbamoyl transferase component Bud32
MNKMKSFHKLKENLQKSNQDAEINKIICFRSPRESQNLRSLKKMGLEIDNILEFKLEESKVIKMVQYNKENQELTLTFKNGKTILYEQVPEEIVQDFLDAKSAGIFFYEHIEKKFNSIEI